MIELVWSNESNNKLMSFKRKARLRGIYLGNFIKVEGYLAIPEEISPEFDVKIEILNNRIVGILLSGETPFGKLDDYPICFTYGGIFSRVIKNNEIENCINDIIHGISYMYEKTMNNGYYIRESTVPNAIFQYYTKNKDKAEQIQNAVWE